MSGEVRVRFAPSPTGYLHIGGTRTALYNWLFARQNKGSFVLRIEDTDRSRSTEEAIEAMVKSLRWLGLEWDEGPEVGGSFGPYRQTERLSLYQKAAEKLLKEEKAYLCYCTPEELKERREGQLKKGLPPKYDRRCCSLSEDEKRKLESKGRKPAIRFYTEDERETVVFDLIRGKTTFVNKLISDFIIVRADGFPTYNFAVVIDDVKMRISHVIRGEDHLSNTPKQLMLYKALGLKAPKFAHHSLIIGSDKTPLSKRHGAVSIEYYQKEGYLAEALLNYIALLGWSYDKSTTIFTVDELIKKFSLERVGKSPAIFDVEKIEWMNGYYIRNMSVEELAQKCIPYLKNAGFVKEAPSGDNLRWLERVVGLEQERIKKLSEIAGAIDFFFVEKLEYDEASVEKVLKKEGVGKVLELAKERLSGVKSWLHKEIEEVLRVLQEELGLKPKFVFQPIRVAVTGRMVSPPLFETLELLGREKSLTRLDKAQALISR